MELCRFVWILFVVGSLSAASSQTPSIGIIGGGIGGTGVAYFLAELLPKARLDLFERTDRLGGRLNLTTLFGNGYETGGSVIHPRNKYAVQLTHKFQLEQRWDSGEAMSIIKDDQYVFNTSKWTLLTILKTLARYGLEFNRLDSLVSGFLDKFTRIYELQAEGEGFKGPKEMLEAMNPLLLNLTRSHFRTLLKDEGFSDLLIDELVQAITLVNYGQDTGVHSFVGSVSTSGGGADLWSVNKGNKQLPESLMKHSKGKLHLNTQVTKVVQQKDEKKYELFSGKTLLGRFDYVVIANPLGAPTQLEFVGLEIPGNVLVEQKFHRTVTTIVAGHVQEKYKYRTSIISCQPDNWYKSISLIHPTVLVVSEKYPVYKIFSSKPLTEEQLNSVFTERYHQEVHDWLAYPEYSSVPPTFSQFQLAPRLYYLNAIEAAASAMEMSLISAKNIANLVALKENKI